MAAACSKLKFLGKGSTAFAGTTTYSAWLPSRPKPRLPPAPKTDCPDSSSEPPATTPAKSRPGVRGTLVSCILPSTFLTSLGLTAAAFTCTSTSPAAGVGIGSSRMLKSSNEPVFSNLKARMNRWDLQSKCVGEPGRKIVDVPGFNLVISQESAPKEMIVVPRDRQVPTELLCNQHLR